MFDATAAHKELVQKIAELTVWRRGLSASPDELNGTAEHLSRLGKLLANYTEAVMADCAASISFGAIAESDANFIWQAMDDCAGQLHEAAERVLEAA